MTVRCVAIDDEPLAIDVIKNYVSRIKGFHLKASFGNAIESLEYLQKESIDLLFLDINMPLLDGFSFLKTLTYRPLVIITTAHEEHAAKSYELEVLDYLIKPISFQRFLLATNKVAKRRIELEKAAPNTIGRDYLFVKIDKKRMKKIFFDEIIVVESLKDYIKIITPLRNYIVHQTLAGFTDLLPQNKFIRIHRSLTVSLDKIDAIEGNSIEISGNRYTIGRSYLEQVKNAVLNPDQG
ncbi:MAG TPA: response regulator transcription factor [Salinimicrobium sp.]|nr:response regulator transcription factor [Salinimicrobium sp.]